MSQNKKEFDLILFGATGFTGKLTANYLASRSKEIPFRLGLAGRSLNKLKQLQQELLKTYPGISQIDVLSADVEDESSIASLVQKTKILVNTVGPYAKYGEVVVRNCAKSGTHYLDITGEGNFVEKISLEYDQIAKSTNAKIINCCGYDSIPADLGSLFTVQNLEGEEKEVECFISTKSRDFLAALQSFSGGTWHSAIGFLNLGEFERQGFSYKTISNSAKPREIHPIPLQFRYREEEKNFGAPLPFVDIEVVLRSAAKLPEYGRQFHYGHYASIPNAHMLLGGIIGAGSLFTFAQIPILKELLLSLRGSGEGPSEDIRNSNQFLHSFVGVSEKQIVKVEVTGGDPGYGDTSKMLGEAALLLLQDPHPDRSGVVTPAYALGKTFIDRLQKIGIQFRLVSKTNR